MDPNILLAVGGGVLALVLAILGFLVRREFSRLDGLSSAVMEIAGTLSGIRNDVSMVLLMRGPLADIERSYHKFFDAGGERETLWKRIDENSNSHTLAIKNLRDRTHWLANRLFILQGKMEVKLGVEFKESSGMPRWED